MSENISRNKIRIGKANAWIQRVKKRKIKDRCVCGHLKFVHADWVGKCGDCMNGGCKCSIFVSETEEISDVRR